MVLQWVMVLRRTTKPSIEPFKNPCVPSPRVRGEVIGSRVIGCGVRGPDLCGVSAPGEEVPVVVAMQRDVQHAGVVVERLLGAVAVVNVLVEDRRKDTAN